MTIEFNTCDTPALAALDHLIGYALEIETPREQVCMVLTGVESEDRNWVLVGHRIGAPDLRVTVPFEDAEEIRV